MIGFYLKIKNIRKETADCISVCFEIPDDWKEEFQFKHGQNITLKAVVDGEEIRRSYSICSSPLDNELRIAVKKALNGKFSSYANEYLKKNHTLEVLAPTGQFFTELNPSNKKNYLAFAAGSGITPVISIIKTTLAKEPQSSFSLIYGNRNRNSIIFKEELEALKNRYMDRFSVYYILSREKTDAPFNQGRIDAEKCDTIFKNLLNLDTIDDFFICIAASRQAFCHAASVDFFINALTDRLHDRFRRNVVIKIIFELRLTPAVGLVDGLLHRIGDLVSIHDHFSIYISS